MPLTIHVVSDVVCPWCYIGKRRLERAIAEFEDEVVTVWHPYQLNPDMPAEGMDRVEYRKMKFGSLERSAELDARIAATAAEEGLPIHFERITRSPNTLNAHRLVWLAGQYGMQNEMVDRLFSAYFVEGRDLGDMDELADLAAMAGLDREPVRELLDGDTVVDEIRAEAGEARDAGIEGVPTFIIGRRAISGAYPSDALLALMREVAAELPDATEEETAEAE